MTFRLGIATWGERAPHPDTGELPSPREGFLQLTELARTADRVGLDIVAVGEGHGAEHVNPDPLQLLAAGHGIGVMLNVMEGRGVLPSPVLSRTVRAKSLSRPGSSRTVGPVGPRPHGPAPAI